MTSSVVGAVAPWTWAAWAARAILYVGVPVLVIFALRRIRRTLPAAALMVTIGLLGRAALGLALFYISYADLPQLKSLHSGDGFWHLALDAKGYYLIAADGADRGIWSIPPGVPSSTFVHVLSLWMTMLGVSPASGLLLNICCYLGISWVIVSRLRATPRAALVGLGAFTFSPALVIFGTQPLKDVLFALLIVVSCAGALSFMRFVAARARDVERKDWAAAAAVVVSVAGMTGIRPYYPLFFIASLGCVLTGLAFWPGRLGLARRLARAAVVLALLVVTWAGTLGPYRMAYLGPLLPASVQTGDGPPGGRAVTGDFSAWDRARDAFIRSGGGTNIGRPDDGRRTLGDRVMAVGVGLLLMFVPVTLLKALGVVSFTGGRGLTALADVDTLFTGLAIAAVAWAIWTGRSRISRPYLVFLAIFSLTVGVSMAYVVTNFGTLFRLRLLLAVPLWMLVLALETPQPAHRAIAPQGASR